MLRVIAIVAGNEHETTELRVDELAMTAFPAMYPDKPRPLQVGDQLENLARHTLDDATLQSLVPTANTLPVIPHQQ
jgi:hypothetical protein